MNRFLCPVTVFRRSSAGDPYKTTYYTYILLCLPTVEFVFIDDIQNSVKPFETNVTHKGCI